MIACGMSMRVQVQLRIVAEDDSVISDDTELLLLDKSDDRLEALGLSLAEAKALLAGVQQRLVTAQAASFAARHRGCPLCGRRRRSKGPSPIVFRTASGTVRLASPRFHRCGCQPAHPKTVRGACQSVGDDHGVAVSKDPELGLDTQACRTGDPRWRGLPIPPPSRTAPDLPRFDMLPWRTAA